MAELLPQGFRDQLPPHADAAERLVRGLLDRIRLYGYERVATPLAEFEAGLVSRLKTARPQDLPRFVDPMSQRTLAIRPDITAQVGRIAATRMAHHPRPVRLCYAGSVMRLRAGEIDPARERMQVGAELIGSDSVAAASEVAAVVIDALDAAGIAGLTVDFTLPDCVELLAAGPLPLDPAALDTVRRLLDAKDAGGLADVAPAYQPLIEATGGFADALARLRSFDTDGLLASRLDGLAAVAATIGDRARLTLDPSERHGFEYHSWLGFSIFVDGITAEIGRGGCYAIARADGGIEPATGFSLYPDALVSGGLTRKDRRRLFLPVGHDPAVAARLRGEGWVTVAALDDADSAAAQLCSHVLESTGPVPLA